MSTQAMTQANNRVSDRFFEVSPMLYARIAGVLYIVITIAAIIAHIYVPSTLIVADDPAVTVSNIVASENLFRMGGIGAELIVLLSEVVLSVILYFLLKPVSKFLSLLAAVSRLIMTAIHGVNLLNYVFVLLIINGSGFVAEQANAMVSLFLHAHAAGFTIGIAFLVIHVFALGYLIYRSGYFPRILGILFLLAGVGYLVDTTALLFVENYNTTPDLIAMVIAVAEIAFPLWLLVMGVRRKSPEKGGNVEPTLAGEIPS